jgi:signal transduction histidine kinase
MALGQLRPDLPAESGPDRGDPDRHPRRNDHRSAGRPDPRFGDLRPDAGSRGRSSCRLSRPARGPRDRELKSSFVAAVSHELRTPLALISGYAQSLLELDLDEIPRRRFVERIDGTANRMRELVDQLLDVATLESDRLAVDPRQIPLRSLLKSIIDDVAEMPGSLAVRLSVPPDLPPVYADPTRIGQVVANLLDNARKYGTPGSMVSIRARRADDLAVVTVDNDGPEIAPEERESIFERFYRGRDARSSGTPGIGLGLHLSRRLVEAHGGQLRLEERTGGTCISLTLPLALEGWTRRDGAQPAADGRGAS